MSALPAIERARFADIMAGFPSGVAIITTTDAEGEPRGLTTTAVCSVSVDPPQVLVCVDRGSRTLPALRQTRRFIVNFIKLGYQEICQVFASKDENKFASLDWERTAGGLPLLREHVISWAECALVQEVEAGDHLVFIGQVTDGDSVVADDVQPLLYYRRAWGGWHPQEDPGTPT